jgi:serine/threonine protein phosphatase 1
MPDGICLYAIGDIHGREDLLRHMFRLIAEDSASHINERKILVTLGDYIDRGPASKEVIQCMLTNIPLGFEAVHLRGNHEDALMRFMAGEISILYDWLKYGGDACLKSYDVDPKMDPQEIYEQLKTKCPLEHREFLRSTLYSYTCGDYFFAHAGVLPNCPLDKQYKDALMYIRDDFRYSTQDFGKIVVHGHAIENFDDPTPVIKPNRIGIDTGAYYSGKLTCVKLWGSKRDFLVTQPT